MKCTRCHRPLKDPESIRRVYGPTCWARINNFDKQGKGKSNLELIPNDPKSPRDILYRRMLDGRIETNVTHTLIRHSPTGFNWGYGGSGPADFALNILLRFVSLDIANALYQDFKFAFIAKMEDGGRILAKDIDAWLEKNVQKDWL